MKKIGISLVILYILLFVGLLIPTLRDYSAIGLILFIPIILILASTNILINKSNYSGRKLLVLFSVLSIVLLFTSKVAFIINADLRKYSDLILYISATFLIAASALILINTITNRTSFNTISDSIILIIPLVGFFLLEFTQFQKYNPKNIERIDILASELHRTYELLTTDNRSGNSKQLTNYDSLPYGEIIRSIDNAYYKVVDYSGGFKEGYTNVLLNPLATEYPDKVFRETNLLIEIRDQFNYAISNEPNEEIKKQLTNLRDDIFGDSTYDNSVVEFRLRCAIAINRLVILGRE